VLQRLETLVMQELRRMKPGQSVELIAIQWGD
jgi:hypothetical protein